MTYIFKNLNRNSTFEDFRAEYIKNFGDDYFDGSEVPTGNIVEANHEFIAIEDGNITLWIDDGDKKTIELE